MNEFSEEWPSTLACLSPHEIEYWQLPSMSPGFSTSKYTRSLNGKKRIVPATALFAARPWQDLLFYFT
jgi:hypothetical protein